MGPLFKTRFGSHPEMNLRDLSGPFASFESFLGSGCPHCSFGVVWGFERLFLCVRSRQLTWKLSGSVFEGENGAPNVEWFHVNWWEVKLGVSHPFGHLTTELAGSFLLFSGEVPARGGESAADHGAACAGGAHLLCARCVGRMGCQRFDGSSPGPSKMELGEGGGSIFVWGRVDKRNCGGRGLLMGYATAENLDVK